MPPLATPKKLLIFALRNLHNKVSHRFYRTLNKRLGVVYPNPYYLVICKFRNLGKATLSLYQFFNYFKFFTDAKLSRKFSTREQHPFITNAQPSDRDFTYSIKKKEPGKASLLPAIGLLIWEFYGYVRGFRAKMVQDYFKGNRNIYYLCPNQRKGILWQRTHLCRSLRKPNENFNKVISFSY